jgi:hypothetical protein
MHIEILTEDSSGQHLLEHLVPKLIGPVGEPHTWRLHAYRGIGRIPANLSATTDPSRRILLDQLPRLLRGYVRTPGIDAVVVVLDADDRNCMSFLSELQSLATSCGASSCPPWTAMFRIPFAAPGNCWPTPSIPVASVPSERPDGPCPAKSSMSGQNGSDRFSTRQAISHQVSVNFVTQ